MVQDMYEGCRTVGSCDRGLQGGSGAEPLLVAVAVVMLTDAVRKESPRAIMYADDIVIYNDSMGKLQRGGGLSWNREGVGKREDVWE